MNTKQQGDIGVAVAISYYSRQGFAVSIPLTDNTRYDLLVDTGEELIRVQCKSTKYKDNNKYRVQLATNGGNQSWSGVVKKLDAVEIDRLFVYCFDGTCYEFGPDEFANKSAMILGPTKKAFIVECN